MSIETQRRILTKRWDIRFDPKALNLPRAIWTLQRSEGPEPIHYAVDLCFRVGNESNDVLTIDIDLDNRIMDRMVDAADWIRRQFDEEARERWWFRSGGFDRQGPS